MNPVIDPKLVALVRQGDQSALGDLLGLCQKQIYNVCLRMVNQKDDAAELAQESMLKVIEHIRDFNGESAITSWMVRIAMNVSISHLRRQKLRKSLSLDSSNTKRPSGWGQTARAGGEENQSTNLLSQMSDTRELEPSSSVQVKEDIEHLLEALDRIDDEFRAVLVLRDLQEMDYQQIADVISVPVGTVKSRLFRARLALRQEMLKLRPPPSHRPATPQELTDG